MSQRITSFDEALKVLNIEDYRDRIFNSSSTGELAFLQEYIWLAETLSNIGEVEVFRDLFLALVNEANEKWERPESIYQYIPSLILNELLKP